MLLSANVRLIFRISQNPSKQLFQVVGFSSQESGATHDRWVHDRVRLTIGKRRRAVPSVQHAVSKLVVHEKALLRLAHAVPPALFERDDRTLVVAGLTQSNNV